jgi:hypothetical protein
MKPTWKLSPELGLKTNWCTNLQPIHWALISHYAKLARKTRSATIRQFLAMVAERDSTFDPDRFRQFVLETIIPNIEDPATRDALRGQLETFLEQRRAA